MTVEAEKAAAESAVPVTTPSRPGTGRFGTFQALRYRNYRYLWFAQIGSSLA